MLPVPSQGGWGEVPARRWNRGSASHGDYRAEDGVPWGEENESGVKGQSKAKDIVKEMWTKCWISLRQLCNCRTLKWMKKKFFFHRGHLRCSYQLQNVLKWQILWTVSKPIHVPVSPPWSCWASLLIRLRIPVLLQFFHTAFIFARNSLLVSSAKSILFRPYVSEIPTSPGKYIGIIMEFLPTSSSKQETMTSLPPCVFQGALHLLLYLMRKKSLCI